LRPAAERQTIKSICEERMAMTKRFSVKADDAPVSNMQIRSFQDSDEAQVIF
jgi:hypothetical protein